MYVIMAHSFFIEDAHAKARVHLLELRTYGTVLIRMVVYVSRAYARCIGSQETRRAIRSAYRT